MNNTTYFPAGYHLIKLYRKAVHKTEPDEIFKRSKTMLAMDYFDALEVRSFKPDTDKFSEFMGLSINENLTEHDVAMQSIPLYCPEMSGEKVTGYCCDHLCYRDPFDDDVGKFRYFGMIQVYITPEVLVRFDKESFSTSIDNKDSLYLNMYDAFYKDIHLLMGEYARTKFGGDKCESFRYRIYQSMSVGDFVVAMRCMDPEVPFEAASILRRRKYEFPHPVKSKNEDQCSNFVFYKTYTLMSLNTHIIQADDGFSGTLSGNDVGEDAAPDRRFVLRCVLSNKYWSDEKKINAEFPPHEFLGSTTCLRLNGRYDFTVTLSEKAFLYIHPELVRYKIGGRIDRSSKAADGERCSADESGGSYASVTGDQTFNSELKVCDFIISLMKNGHISYVNERFIFKGSEDPEESRFYNESIVLREAEDGFLFANEVNARQLEALRKEVQRTYQRVLKIDTSRQSIIYSMRLLERFVSTCNSINGISDTRIYCSIIMKQIRVILSGVNYYLSYLGVSGPDAEGNEDTEAAFECSEEEYYDLLAFLDSNLKEALEYMNLFAKFILDSSLQSLQTPHYNLETHVSVEKLLLGYSNFVQQFFHWYRDTEICRSIQGISSEYLTLMVPQPMDSSLSTTTLFNWRKNESQMTRLLVVLCPSFSDLTEFPASVGILLHEIAHSLRYEERAVRNNMILRYSNDLIFGHVSDCILLDMRKKIPGIINYDFYLEEIQQCLSLAYEKYIGLDSDIYADKSFSTLTDDIYARYTQFVYAIEYLSALRNLMRDFLADTNYRLKPKYKTVAYEVYNFNEIFFDDRSRQERELSDYLNAYDNLVISIEEFLLNEADREEKETSEYERISQLNDLLVNYYYTSDNTEMTEFLTLCSNVVKFEREVNRSFRERIMHQRNEVEARKIARYLNLGMYATLAGEEQNFANYVECIILLCQSGAKDVLTSNLDIYREITSDLYMVKLLGLTPYGYLNFYTKNIPVDDIMTETYARRFCMVLYAMECEIHSGDAIDWDSVWVEIYRSICGHITDFTDQYCSPDYNGILLGGLEAELQNKPMRIPDYLKKLGEKISSVANATNIEDILDNMRFFADGAVAIHEFLSFSEDRTVVFEQEKFVTDLLHCRYLCSNFLSLVYEYQQQLQSIYRFDYLAEDLRRGSRNLSALHEEFTKSDLWKYCSFIPDVYNKDRRNHVDHAGINQLMAEFVLDMNYSMMYGSAFEMAGDHPSVTASFD